jgi:hypothetical protein
MNMTTHESHRNDAEDRTDGAMKPLYAVAGLTDLVASTVRVRLHAGRAMAAERWTQLLEQARTRRSDLGRINLNTINFADLQHNTRTAYAGLAGRGKHVVDDARDHARDAAREFGNQAGPRLRGTMAGPFGRATDFARPMADKLFKHERAEQQSADTVTAAQQAADKGSATEKPAAAKAKKPSTGKPAAAKPGAKPNAGKSSAKSSTEN